MLVVQPLSDHATEYMHGVRNCETLDRLREFTLFWADLAPDAFAIARRMNQADFIEFKTGLKKETRKKYAGDTWAERYGDILLPKVILMVAAVAERYMVPWGLAFIRLEAAGIIVRNGDVYQWEEPKGVRDGNST